jgi:cytochrome c peroxidase
MKKLFFVFSTFALLTAVGCRIDEKGGSGYTVATTPSGPDDKDLTDIPCAPHYFVVAVPQGFPAVEHPADNPISHEGVELGRHLFYDVRLSKGEKMSCGSCHLKPNAFSDPLRLSVGVDGLMTDRHSMAIMNLGLKQKTFFWDGRATSLEAQALEPIENHKELNETWSKVVVKLKADTMYHRLFRRAFCIRKVGEITKELAVKAIAQFERTIVVGGESRYHKVFVRNQGFASDEELDGYNLFFNKGTASDAQCFHCHNEPLFKSGTGDSEFANNGLDLVASLDDYIDKGRGGVTGNRNDNGKFRATTLWNITLSAPYMHDGRFSSLKKVVDFYSDAVQVADNIDPFVTQIHLNTTEKRAILSFLDMLTDTTSLNKPEFQSPFPH